MRKKINAQSSHPLALLPTEATPHFNQGSQIKIERKNKAYILECEALRGIAILLVVLFHCSLRIGKITPISPNLLNSFILSGNTGVTLFFVLSGFLLNLPFMAGAPVRPRNFFIKRALRILPMYSCVVILGAIYRNNILAGIQSLLFLNTKIGTLWPFGAVWWSLAVEVQFYFLLPYLHLLWRSQHWRWLLLPILIIAVYFYFEITRSSQGDYYFIPSARDSILALWPTFMCGAILAAVHAHYGTAIKNYCHKSKLLRMGGGDIIVCLLILLLAFILLKISTVGNFKAYVQYFDHVVLEAAVWSLIIAATLYLPAHAKAVITNPALVLLGLISYSLYLLHAPVIFFSLRFLNALTNIPTRFSLAEMLGFCLVLAVMLSTFTYHLIEKPMLGLKKKFSTEKISGAQA